MDWLLGGFAEAHLTGVDAAGLVLWEEVVQIPDPQLYDWIMGRAVCEDARISAMVGDVRTFHRL